MEQYKNSKSVMETETISKNGVRLKSRMSRESGFGFIKDYSEAARWIQKSAEQGNDLAQYDLGDLGVLYVNGYGVTQDYTIAVKWIQKSAEQGNAKAQYNLGAMYENGYGISKNKEIWKTAQL